jgi:glycine/D-amino acid oxidase-like deaminating enzyme
MGWTSDFMPYVGEVPGKPNQMILAGFSGHGMPLILLSAKAIVQMIRQGSRFEETGVPEIFRATEERLKSTKNEILGGHTKPKL